MNLEDNLLDKIEKSLGDLMHKDVNVLNTTELYTKKMATVVNFFLIYFIYLFLAALGLRCCARAFSSCSEQGLLFIAVHRLLIAVASLVEEHGL